MLSIKPKTAFTNILEGGLPPTVILTAMQKPLVLNLLLYFVRPYRLHDTYDLFPNTAFLFSDELKVFVTSQSHQKQMHNSESIYKNFSTYQLALAMD